MNYYVRNTELLGDITICEEEGFITEVHFGKKQLKSHYELTKTLKEAFEQLEEYLSGKRKSFTLPLNPKGTSFQQKIWSILYSIPYGETRTYKEIALLSGNKNASRAVGMANHNNPIPIFIPCHRVIGSDGNLTGYAEGLDVKILLLNLENYNKLD